MPHRVIHIIASLTCLCLMAGCGKKPAETEAPAAESPAAAPAASPQASLPQPSGSSRKLYITESFQTESAEGIHDFPRGGEVELIAIIEEDYLVQRNGVSVRISRTFFSETPVSPEPAGTPLPSVAAPTPEAADMIPGEAPVQDATPAMAAQPAITPAATPEEPALLAEETPPPLSAEDRKIEELTESIRELNDRIRSVRQTLAADQSQPEPAEVRKLQKERDQLSKELTGLVKP